MKNAMPYKFIRPFGILLTGAILISLFQNCSKVNFVETPTAILNASAGDPGVNIVCDPFSANSTCSTNSGEGLLGNVYHLPNTTSNNNVGVQHYIDYGTKLNLYIQLSSLNIPLRQWSAGFPDGKNGSILDAQGQPLIEYFALDLRGKLTLNQELPEGQYQFAIASDDGAILDVDGEIIVNNDGWHGRSWKCATKSVDLKKGVPHPLRLRYYQGPRVEIALQVYMRPMSMQGQSCDDNGGWQIIPSTLLSH